MNSNETFVKLIVPTTEAMQALGMKLAESCTPTAVIFLQGELGAGKTTFSQGFLRGLGYLDRVKSPTYTLVEPYTLPHQTVYHFDLYRLHDPTELELIGVQEYFVPHVICLVEWPDKGAGFLPAPDLSCHFHNEKTVREIKIYPHTAIGTTILQRFEHNE